MAVGVLMLWAMALAAEPASAQTLSSQGLEPSLALFRAGFPASEPLAIAACCIVAGTLLLRLTRWLGLALTVATFGFIAVLLLLATEPQALAYVIEAVRRS